ncbi:MAG: hypothetical protein A2900_01300 [Candidatus Chisholmbacteria bacterium RIFCSPLOWO2_01_FULL_50_28]|uniref:Uncharacterized protein n=1 Tax=Candidatus Chisholmbacteria bacterium RIFCSPHIGHO2_01_FULL_52_32 TaxID=1797591 RepID=A0A1G1VUB1_9BACT|nr:MAG: hypothetical protein A2786_05440 [Candidatus Chisholmbacteria bacterium RIFCSPHIGHO2_01_FULL_52_32]OGY19725.1 MAG: hypothetical protein A2900_01300 [Candidatus Chisholmbacteria bacterium RIFCSPLOWO2_01_FULL_50_28]
MRKSILVKFTLFIISLFMAIVIAEFLLRMLKPPVSVMGMEFDEFRNKGLNQSHTLILVLEFGLSSVLRSRFITNSVLW